MSDLQRHEIDLARERIRTWPMKDRVALTRLTEQEARTIMLATALLDIRPAADPPIEAIEIDLRGE